MTDKAKAAFKEWALARNWTPEAVERMPSALSAIWSIFEAGYLAASPVVQRPKPHNHEIQTDQINWRHTIEQSPVAVLYTGSIDGEMVGRDDIWLAKTSQLAASPLPQVDALDGARLDWLEEAYTRGARERHEWANFMTHVAEVGYRRAIDAAMKQGSN